MRCWLGYSRKLCELRDLKPASEYEASMSVTVELSADEVAQIKRFTEVNNDSDAVTKAAREFLRTSQLRELKSASGKVDYQDVGTTMEALELREQNSNR